jgi:hypothetical protein
MPFHLEVLQNQGAFMPIIIQGGRFVKRGTITKGSFCRVAM